MHVRVSRRGWAGLLALPGLLVPLLVAGFDPPPSLAATASRSTSIGSTVAHSATAKTAAARTVVSGTEAPRAVLVERTTASEPATSPAPVPFVYVGFGPGVDLRSGPRVRSLEAYFHLGSYLNRNGNVTRPGYCVNYVKGLGGEGRYFPTGVIKGFGLKTQQLLIYLVNNFGNTSSNDQAAAVALDVQLLTGGHDFAMDYPTYLAELGGRSGAVPTLARSLLAQARLYRGPIAVKLTGLTPVPTGSRGHVTASVYSLATGHAIPGRSFRVSMVGAVAMGRQPARSNAAGRGTFTWLRTSLGAVTIRVTVTSANSRVTFMTHPPVASQGLLAQYPAETRAAQLRYNVGVGAARMAYHCTAVCNGAPPITIDYGNTTQSLERLTTSVGGRALGAPVLLHPGATAHLTYIVHDTNIVVVKVEIRVQGHWTTLVVIGSLRVDCPPLPVAAVMLVCHCTSGGMTVGAPVSPYALGAFHNTTSHTWVIELRGYKMFYIRPGQTLAPISVPAGGKRLSYDVYVGVINSAGVTTDRYVASGTVG